ncbi:hypothetical protein ACVIQY_000060 [Bradyrhizobium sp. USDA 3051]
MRSIEATRSPVRLVSWLSSSRAIVSTCWPNAADLLRHHGEARALRAGARAFDQRVQRQHLHLVGDLLDRLGLVDRDLVDLRREAVDQRGDIGIIISGFICDRLGFETQRSRHRGLPLAMRSDLQRTRNNH